MKHVILREVSISAAGGEFSLDRNIRWVGGDGRVVPVKDVCCQIPELKSKNIYILQHYWQLVRNTRISNTDTHGNMPIHRYIAKCICIWHCVRDTHVKCIFIKCGLTSKSVVMGWILWGGSGWGEICPRAALRMRCWICLHLNVCMDKSLYFPYLQCLQLVKYTHK